MSRFRFLLPVLLCIAIACTKEDQPVFFDPGLTITPFPENGSANNSFLIRPYLVFNKQIEFRQDDPAVFEGSYVIKIDNISFMDGRSNPVPFSSKFSSSHDTLHILPEKGFSANEIYNISLNYSIMISEDNGNTYNPMLKNGVPYKGEFSSSFTVKTYSLPEKIDTSLIQFSYPVPYQYHFLRFETDRGVVGLKESNEALSYYDNVKYKARFSDMTGNTWETDAVYESENNKFTFKIPSANLQNEKIYKFEIVKSGEEGNGPLFQWHFRTSKFDTFAQKIASVNNVQNNLSDFDDVNLTIVLWNSLYISESFDFAEGKPYTGLIRMEAKPDLTNTWFSQFNYFYSKFSTYIESAGRPKFLTIPPLNAIYFDKKSLSPLLTSTQINTNSAPASTIIQQWIQYSLAGTYQKDLSLARNKVINLRMQTNQWIPEPPEFENLHHGYNYRIKLCYYAGDLITYENNNFVFVY